MIKTILSAGGPYIALPEQFFHLWGGAERSSFAGFDQNDYEIAGGLTDGVKQAPCNAEIFRGAQADGIIISMPVETAIISSTKSDVLIAQAHYREPSWCFDDVEQIWFSNMLPQETLFFQALSGNYKLFDAAYCSEDVEEDCLEFILNESLHKITTSLFKPDQYTLLTLVRVRSFDAVVAA